MELVLNVIQALHNLMQQLPRIENIYDLHSAGLLLPTVWGVKI